MITVNELSAGRAIGGVIHLRDSEEVIQLTDSGEVIQLRDSGALVVWLFFLGTLFIYLFLNRECISGRWGKLSFPTQYESWSVPNNISGGDMYDFLSSDV